MDLTLRVMRSGRYLTSSDEAQAVERCDAGQLDKGGGAAQRRSRYMM